MGNDMRNEGGVVVVGERAEIDMRSPFKSVKDAVALFGERVLAGEIIANKLKEMRSGGSESSVFQASQSRITALTAELEEAKRNLFAAREENSRLTICVKYLREELEDARRKLSKELKFEQVHKKQPTVTMNPEIEDFKFINVKELRISEEEEEEEKDEQGFRPVPEKKRSVKFASPPSLAKVIVNKEEENAMEMAKNNKGNRKPLITLMGWLVSKRKTSISGSLEDRSPQRGY